LRTNFPHSSHQDCFEPTTKWRCHPQIPLFLFCFRLAVALFVSRGATGARGRFGLGQETLTKTLLQQKNPRVKQGLPVRKKPLQTATFISALLFLAVASALFVSQREQTHIFIITSLQRFRLPQAHNHPKLSFTRPKTVHSIRRTLTLLLM
jgi:hypothetical protein